MYDDDDNDKIMASMMNIIIMMNMMTMHSFVINVTMVKLTKTNMTMVITMGFSTILSNRCSEYSGYLSAILRKPLAITNISANSTAICSLGTWSSISQHRLPVPLSREAALCMESPLSCVAPPACMFSDTYNNQLNLSGRARAGSASKLFL